MKAVAYCQTIVKLFKTLPTYTWLANAGITPSTSQTYELSDILDALQTGSGGVSNISVTNGACYGDYLDTVYSCCRLLRWWLEHD